MKIEIDKKEVVEVLGEDEEFWKNLRFKKIEDMVSDLRKFLYKELSIDLYQCNIVFNKLDGKFGTIKSSNLNEVQLNCVDIYYILDNIEGSFKNYIMDEFRRRDILYTKVNIQRLVILHELGHMYDFQLRGINKERLNLYWEKVKELKRRIMFGEVEGNIYGKYFQLPLEKFAQDKALEWLEKYLDWEKRVLNKKKGEL